MTQVKAPYNFVPLNKRVFFPYWANFVNQDVPFENSLSGKIKLKITAETPLFIRGDEEINSINPEFKQYKFKKLGDKYCIPGTTIKGELASVLENLSFAKLKDYNDVKFSVRDFYNKEIYDKSLFANCLGGWLYKNDQEKFIIEYNDKKPGRIKHSEIDRIYKKDFVDNFGIHFKNNQEAYKAAKKKYDIIGSASLVNNFDYDFISGNRDVFKINGSAKEKGTIVFTGQPSKRQIKINKKTKKQVLGDDGNPLWIGKHLEFIFWEPNKEIEVDDQTIKNFFFAYFDKDIISQSIDWKYWKPKLENGNKIPVFFKVKKGKDDKNKVEHLGLSMLYKLPYDYDIKDLINKNVDHAKPKLDLIDTLLGYVSKKESEDNEFHKSKGRISIEPALNTNNSEEMLMVTKILGSPKASYYPFYIWQNPNNNNNIINGEYKTFNDDAEIAGRKRYPVQSNSNMESVELSKTTTSFYPLNKGVVFETLIHYHNLRTVELGALLSTLTFHNNLDNCHHSLGMAKSFGFGNVSIEIDYNNSDILEIDLKKYLCAFEKVMTKFETNWINSEQVNELFCIATPINSPNEKLKYLKLDPNNSINEFVDIKKEKKALPRYSDYMNITKHYTSYLGKCEFNIEKDELKFKIDKKTIYNELENYTNEKINTIIKRNSKEEYKKQGISLLLQQKTMKTLISKTNTWIGYYYNKEEQKKIKAGDNYKIPDEYHEAFLNHVKSLYTRKPKENYWRMEKGTENSKGYRYLKMCVVEAKTKEWLIVLN